MIVASSITALAPHSVGRWVAIGYWDGVHIGHQGIVRGLVQGAQAAGAQAVVMGFHPHPMAVLRPNQAPLLIQSLAERATDLAALGTDIHLVLPFNPEFAGLSPEAFVEEILLQGLGMRQVMVGFNFTFGRGGRGTAQTLADLCRPHGVTVHIIHPVRVAGETVSSTAVRYCLAAGDVERATEFLGHPYRIIRPVVHGDQRGRQLGYPTANLDILPNRQLPATGVYAVRVTVLDQADLGCPDVPEVWPPASPLTTWLVPDGLSGRRYGGMLNLGQRPTFQGTELRCEVHLLDFSGDLYGRRLRVEFVSRLRAELPFAGVEALVAQLRQDEAESRLRLRRFDPSLEIRA